MNQRSLTLARRKERLLLESARQRQLMSEYAAGLSPLFSGVDKVSAAARWLQQHPALLAASSALLFFLRPRRAWRWGLRALSIWRLSRTFLRLR